MSTALRRGEPLPKLLKRAGMSIYSYNSRVVIGCDDQDGRLMASSGAMDHKWGDCLTMMFRNKGMENATWQYFHLSPARARILAHHLLQIAAYKENENGLNQVDPLLPKEDAIYMSIEQKRQERLKKARARKRARKKVLTSLSARLK